MSPRFVPTSGMRGQMVGRNDFSLMAAAHKSGDQDNIEILPADWVETKVHDGRV